MLSIKLATLVIMSVVFAMKTTEAQPIRNSDPVLCGIMRNGSNSGDINSRQGNIEISQENHSTIYYSCLEVDQHFDIWGG